MHTLITTESSQKTAHNKVLHATYAKPHQATSLRVKSHIGLKPNFPTSLFM